MTDSRDFNLLMQVFFLGELVGLPTLNSILVKFGIKSNLHQIKYKKLCKQLTISKVRKMYEYVFEYQLKEELQKMSQKDSSCWSKELVTVVLDDSVFKQWLQSNLEEKGLDEYYGIFFSGQFRSTVHGYKVVTLGVVINGIFNPLYFDFVRKKVEGTLVEKTIEVAEKLVKKWGLLVANLKKEGYILPDFHFSCDNGYSNNSLCKTCEENGLVYISVPKKSHCIEALGHKIKISEYIQEEFIKFEKEHQDLEKELSQEEKTPFVHRFKASYVSQNKEVTFLAFRLNGSKKISVIYCPNKNIFAKTLRRHWFNRTYIEQFFKWLKHVLKIQEARTKNRQEFENKLWKFAFMAWHGQKLIRYLRSQIKELTKKSFISLQRMLCSDADFLDLLHKKVSIKF